MAEDALVCDTCGPVGRFHRGVWDFEVDDYAGSFGSQWRQFAGTQVDSKNGTTISADRFLEITGWKDLTGLQTLDAGCGAGRFAEVAASLGATLTAMDLSEAAFVARELLDDEVVVVRGNLLAPPLRPESFDRLFSIGVLQHTPDPCAAAAALVRLLRPGGEAAFWIYEHRRLQFLLPRHLLRPVTTRLSQPAVRRLVARLVTVFTPLARLIGALPPRLGRILRRGLPIASYWGVLPLDDEAQREWSRLDTEDWLTPRYDAPQRFEEVRASLVRAGATAVHRMPVPGLALVVRRGS